MNILIVEKDDVWRRWLAQELKGCGRVYAVGSGWEAMGIIARVICDCSFHSSASLDSLHVLVVGEDIGQLSPAHLVAIVQKKLPDSLRLVVSNHTETRDALYKVGATQFYIKDYITPGWLTERIREMLRQRPPFNLRLSV